jgi:hypothetical protein
MKRVILKAYIDNSGEEDDPQHKVCSMAGYITTAKKWRKFEKLWKQTLIMYKVPYLHMKEFAHYKPPFDTFWDKELKKEKSERKAFLQALINIMEETNLSGIISTIRLADFKKFNEDRGLCLDVHAFNLYVCMFIISTTWQNKPVEIIIDRINKSGKMMDKAKEYAETDIFLAGYTDNVQLSVLAKGFTFREIVPIQVADFLAWEIRKYVDSKDEWFSKFKIGDDPKAWNKSMKEWSKKKGINTRKTYELLSERTFPYGFVWDYKELCALDKARNHIWP